MKRAMLHKSKFDEFLKYLSGSEISFGGGEGDYDVIQVCVGSDVRYHCLCCRSWAILGVGCEVIK